MKKEVLRIIMAVFICAFLSELWIIKINKGSQEGRLTEDTLQSMDYRSQEIGEEMLKYILEKNDAGESVGLYLLESDFGYKKFQCDYNEFQFKILKEKWELSNNWSSYIKYTKAIWDDVVYFPVPESTLDKGLKVSFSNSWMYERTYGGKRGHEGTDIMASQNIPGIYPIVSITDGIVKNKGWLEKGGYRIGIESPSGVYFYYAHLDSYASLNIGDKVKAGDILGFMGDTGYGEEGTRGKFPVHLHVGIYIYPEGELSINPYWVLRYLENRKIKCAYSCGDIE